MKIHQLLSGIQMPVSNKEHAFIESHKAGVKLTSLDESERWIAQSLVRKGIYLISKDNITLIKNSNETHS